MIDTQKTILFDLGGVIFASNTGLDRPPTHESSFYILEAGLNILKQCHAQKDIHGKKLHQLLILSNATMPTFAQLKKEFGDVINLFDDAVISGAINMAKPDARIYLYTLKKFNLDPKNCIFIDDMQVNVLAAQAVGMHGIVYDNPENTEQALKKQNII